MIYSYRDLKGYDNGKLTNDYDHVCSKQYFHRVCGITRSASARHGKVMGSMLSLVY